MDTTRAEQIALDDALVAPANRLKIGKTDVLEIYMQEFWATATIHHHSIRFKMDNKKHIVNLEYFREMLQICPKLPNQQFEELPFEEAILTFLRDLGHSGEIKMITDVNVNKLHQPWRSFVVVINKCLSGKSTGYVNLQLSQAQILWGMYNKKNVDYAYLMWEDFVYQVENKNVKKSNEMYYPRFTKVIVNFFMTKDQSIPRRNSVNWHYARDDYMFTMIKEPYLQKMQVESNTSKNPPTAKGKILKTSVKADKPAKKKQPAKTSKAKGADEGTGSIPEAPDVPTYDSDDEQISWKSSEEDNEDEVNDDDNDDDVDKDMNDDDADNQDDANQDDDDDDDDEQTDSDNDGDDFVHPKLSTHDDEARKDNEVNEEESNEESDDESNEESDEEVQGANTEDEEMDEEATHEEDEANELYRDVNVNLEGRDTVMTDAPLPNVQATQETEDTHVIITALINPEGQQQSSSVSSGFISNMLNPRPDTGIDSIFTLNTEATSLVDVLVTTIAEPPLVSATTLPPPPTPLITHMQQTPVPTPTTVSSPSLQNLPNFWNLLVMSTINVESLLLQNFRLSNDMATNIWIGSPFLTNLNVEDCLAFGLSKDVYKKYYHPKACGRSSIRCRESPKEAQHHKAGYVDPHGFEGYLKMEVKVPDSS
ncbi:hypothetical protein Tco_0364595 [Tanacetum coccineum]